MVSLGHSESKNLRSICRYYFVCISKTMFTTNMTFVVMGDAGWRDMRSIRTDDKHAGYSNMLQSQWFIQHGTKQCGCQHRACKMCSHDDVIKWRYFPRFWPFVRGIHRSPVSSPHKGQWRGALMFSLICAWINGWVNNREAGDLTRHRAHCDAIVMNIVWNV